MKKKFFKKALAFTLAEVLITLSILGVVAAITVPSLIKRQHRNEVETKLKKFYATIQNALDISIVENGPIETWTYDDSENKSKSITDKYIAPYLNISEIKLDDGWTASNPVDGGSGMGAIGGNQNFAYRLKDGTAFSIPSRMSFNGAKSLVPIEDSDTWAHGTYMEIVFDINGKKKPNTLGKDIFVFDVYKSKSGGNYISTYQSPNDLSKSQISTKKSRCTSMDVNHCYYFILQNHFKIPSDYPWL